MSKYSATPFSFFSSPATASRDFFMSASTASLPALHASCVGKNNETHRSVSLSLAHATTLAIFRYPTAHIVRGDFCFSMVQVRKRVKNKHINHSRRSPLASRVIASHDITSRTHLEISGLHAHLLQFLARVHHRVHGADPVIDLHRRRHLIVHSRVCLLYTSDAADEL